MSATLKKLLNYQKLMEDVHKQLDTAQLAAAGISNLLERDTAEEVIKQGNQRPRTPTGPSSAKKARFDDVLDIEEDDAYTWQDYFNAGAKKKLNIDDSCKAQEWKTKLVTTYEKEMAATNEDGSKIYGSITGPLRGIVDINMSHGRHNSRVKYIGMIGFLTNFNGEGIDAEYMSNGKFKQVVNKKHIQTLKDWRYELFVPNVSDGH